MDDTPRGIITTSHYASAAPTMTQFAQGAAAVMRYSHEEPVREIAQGMLVGTQFQHFISEVTMESTPAIADVHVSSHAYDYHMEEIDLSYPVDVAGTLQARPLQPSQYESANLPERHSNASYYRRRRRRLTQLNKVDKSHEHLRFVLVVLAMNYLT
ncbi:uncharacterized protein LOC130810684 [Amaranthus tricolor]|uniref:uncharacterized protein LOC130810684 n=1 Tax=Amaranthus tricolor TaxID=29722 RepID=UPI002585118A|nr:uncharacterized protein LOC130810684 [Amaranthus tricolor]